MVIDDQSTYINSIGRQNKDQSNLKSNKKLPQNVEAFSNFLKNQIDSNNKEGGVKLSGHALKRLEERNLTMDGNEFLKIRDGIDKLKEKGGKDSLIVTNQAAYIVDVDKQTVVTAMDKNDMAENVFTKIDSTLFLN